jgi:serine/threonine-protein kinase
MIGQTVSHYRILERLGQGGMGVVYKAEDIQLKRTVALKFLPPDLSGDAGATERFIREAQAASALEHTNICSVHEIGEHDGRMFIVMGYYEGETLKDRIARGGLPLDEALDVAFQVAQGLAKAHEAGIVHRDVKPANIIITTDGVAKIVDFGLAKLSGRTMLTKSGVTSGTVAYMSPEQAKGDPVDQRTDIWSLGVMLYEMVAGRLPFRGDYDQAIIYQTLNSEPEPVGTHRPEAPVALQGIIEKAMRKKPQERYPQIKAMCADLLSLKTGSGSVTPGRARFERSRWRGPKLIRNVGLVVVSVALVTTGIVLLSPPPAAIDSIVLLPFANPAGDSTLEYLSDGLTENLINRFSQLPQLRVIARTTAFSFKGKEQDPRAVGRALDVRAVLTGKIVRRGDLLTIQTELVDALEGTQIWGERYHRKAADILALQEELAEQISDRLRLRLSGEEQRRLTRSFTRDTEAYYLYLKGRYWSERLTEEGFGKAVGYYNQAIERDPAYALAYAGLADAYYWVSNTYLPPREAMEKSRAAAMRALDRDSLLSEVRLSLALVKMAYDFDWPGAEAEFRRSIELNPGFAGAHLWLGRYLTFRGRFDEGTAELQRAKQLDPLSPFISIETGLPAFFMRRYDEAIENARKTVEMYPSFYFAHYVLGDQELQRGDVTSAVAEFQTALRLEDSPVALAGLGRAYAAAGEISRADSILRDLSRRRYPPAYDIALIYSTMGKTDRAFAWLRQAYEDRNDQLVWLRYDPRLDPLRSDPRFMTLIQELDL